MIAVALLCLSTLVRASVIKDDDIGQVPALKWPGTCKFDATKLQLVNGRVEEFQIWQNGTDQRIDKGVTQSYILNEDVYYYHPQSNDNALNEIACFVMYKNDFWHRSFIHVLPNVEDYNYTLIGKELIRDRDILKYTNIETKKSKETRNTIWAEYDDIEKTWIPIKYEYIVFNDLTGALLRHNVWEFTNFNTSFDSSIWDIDKTNCSEDIFTTAPFIEVIDDDNPFITANNFENYKRKFDKQYEHEREHELRKEIYERNLNLVLSTNRQNLGYKLAINEFADRTPEEMARRTGLRRRVVREKGNIAFPYNQQQIKELSEDLPTEYDLRMFGLVGPIKDQGECASCWTFGTTAATEGVLARLNNGRLLKLSNQALIDCAWRADMTIGSMGCSGGFDTDAYGWMMKYGLPTEEEYGPYLNGDGECHIENVTTRFPIRGFTDVPPFDNEALKIAVVHHGPLSVSVNTPETFNLYAGGIYNGKHCNLKFLTHEVTLVGYAQHNGEDFWIIKNSWGNRWGVDGFMYISMKYGACGITTEPTYPVF